MKSLGSEKNGSGKFLGMFGFGGSSSNRKLSQVNPEGNDKGYGAEVKITEQEEFMTSRSNKIEDLPTDRTHHDNNLVSSTDRENVVRQTPGEGNLGFTNFENLDNNGLPVYHDSMSQDIRLRTFKAEDYRVFGTRQNMVKKEKFAQQWTYFDPLPKENAAKQKRDQDLA